MEKINTRFDLGGITRWAIELDFEQLKKKEIFSSGW
jgi:hypothetical protein